MRPTAGRREPDSYPKEWNMAGIAKVITVIGNSPDGFAEAAQVTGVVLTKLDGSAKGGIAVAIAYELGLPVKLIGVGEGLDDLRPFDPQDFARALVSS